MGTHFCEVNENVKAYKLGVHQHTPEIEQALERVGKGEEIRVTFSTHLIPMTRGIMCTMYAQLKEPKTTTEIIQFFEQFYASILLSESDRRELAQHQRSVWFQLL